MASSIGGYRSPVDLGLGRVPITQDPSLFNEMTDVYNAIHLLNQYLDQLRITAEGGGGSDQSPADSMPFNRFFVGTAIHVIEIGNIVSPSTISGQNGIVNGALPNNHLSTDPTSNFSGVALTRAEIGEDVRVGIGPAIIEFPGLTTDKILWAFSNKNSIGALTNAGGLYIGNPGATTIAGGLTYAMPVATCPENGFALFGQYIAR